MPRPPPPPNHVYATERATRCGYSPNQKKLLAYLSLGNSFVLIRPKVTKLTDQYPGGSGCQHILTTIQVQPTQLLPRPPHHLPLNKLRCVCSFATFKNRFN